MSFRFKSVGGLIREGGMRGGCLQIVDGRTHFFCMDPQKVKVCDSAKESRNLGNPSSSSG